MLESIRHCHLQHCISKRISRLSSAIEEKGVQVSFCLQQSTFWFFSPTAGEATSYNNVRISIEPVNAWKTRILALQCFADFLNICTRAFGTRGWHRTSCARSLKCRVRWRAPKRTMSPQNRKIWCGYGTEIDLLAQNILKANIWQTSLICLLVEVANPTFRRFLICHTAGWCWLKIWKPFCRGASASLSQSLSCEVLLSYEDVWSRYQGERE